jgi:hypothetical protein
MADKPGKYAAALAALAAPQKPEPPTVLLPEKKPVLSGKRSTPGWKPKQVLLKKETVMRAQERLKARGDKTDFSDLMQTLLEAWLQTPE